MYPGLPSRLEEDIRNMFVAILAFIYLPKSPSSSSSLVQVLERNPQRRYFAPEGTLTLKGIAAATSLLVITVTFSEIPSSH